MIVIICYGAFCFWLGAYLVWLFFERSVRAGYIMYMDENNRLTWMKK